MDFFSADPLSALRSDISVRETIGIWYGKSHVMFVDSAFLPCDIQVKIYWNVLDILPILT